ncbi:SET domain-containing protein [Neolentinus lepideus HHB14362 ss-1]|uniref:SET domain-containing protein n=1 Tax=Neolentinus lepideus HHB14362 ss-1 TaxID=1314782 RepID=A0A165UZN3_9AGAM|nr:SET domain-containing protein [Neolentinus lepideus HHB14362 ss-1]
MDIAHPPDISYATQGSSRDSSLVTETEDISSGIRGISLETWASPGPSSPQDYYQAKDMPHLLQDHINSLPPSYLKSDFVREIFEAHISESTAEDEPDAPQIRIYNPIEGDDETSPPWEFHYSNHMWHGEGVPAPEYSKVRCSCKGPCDPKSKTCACLRRQEGYTRDAEGAKGFMYDNKGRLNMKLMQYPIFECNDLCSCSDECRNRVVQHGRKCSINIVKTKEKGWGVFAGEKPIPEGTYLGIYSGELLSDAEGEERGLKYNKFGRTYLFNIDWWYLQRDEPEIKYVVDAYHIGNFTRFLNHSCAPNCCLVPCYVNEGNLEKPLFTVFTLHDVQPYEELCFSYRGLDDDSDHQSAPNQTDAIYVPCRCGAATCKGKMFL